MPYEDPAPHPDGFVMPTIDSKFIPQHVAIVMDGNGRSATQRCLPRTGGHRAGEQALLDAMSGAVEMGNKYVSVYAFSAESWKRSPDEVACLIGFSRDVLSSQRDTLYYWSVKERSNGRKP